jgi:hypothetical protein
MEGLENLSFKIGDFTVKPCHLISIAIGAIIVYFYMRHRMKKCVERESKVRTNLETFLSSDYAQGLGIDAKTISAEVFNLG